MAKTGERITTDTEILDLCELALTNKGLYVQSMTDEAHNAYIQAVTALMERKEKKRADIKGNS